MGGWVFAVIHLWKIVNTEEDLNLTNENADIIIIIILVLKTVGCC